MGTRSDNIWNCQAAKENKDMALDSCTRSNRIPDFLATKTVLGLASGHSGKTARKVFWFFFSFLWRKIFYICLKMAWISTHVYKLFLGLRSSSKYFVQVLAQILQH